MLRSLGRSLSAAAILCTLAGPALPSGLQTTITDEHDRVIGTPSNPLSVTGGGSTATQAAPGANPAAADGVQGVDGGKPVGVAPAAGTPTDAATTQQSLSGLTAIGTRAAEPTGLGLWFVQNQSAAVMYLVFFAANGTTRIGTIAVDPGAGQGRQGGSASAQDFGPFKGPMTLYGASGAQATLTRQ